MNHIAESQADEGPKVAAKPRAKKSAPAAPEKKPARKTTARAPRKKTAKAPKKNAAKATETKAGIAPTAPETAYNAISKSNEGVNTETLMKENGYNRKKVANMVYKLRKQGKINYLEKGVYVKA